MSSKMVCRQNGPGTAIVYADNGESIRIKIGEWASATKTIQSIAQFGSPVVLPPDAKKSCHTFVANKESIDVFSNQTSKDAFKAEMNGAGVETIRRLVNKRDDSPAVAVVVSTENSNYEQLVKSAFDYCPLASVICVDLVESDSSTELPIANYMSANRGKYIQFQKGDKWGMVASSLEESINWVLLMGLNPLLEGDVMIAIEEHCCSDDGGVVRMRGDNFLMQKSLFLEYSSYGDNPELMVDSIHNEYNRSLLPRIGVVVTVHNAMREVRQCLMSMHEFSFGGLLDVDVYVIDDKSDPSIGREVQSLCEKFGFTYVLNTDNLGYTRSVTAGTELAFKNGAGWVCLLNSDTVVTPGWLWKMVRAGMSDDSISLVGPLSNNAVNSSIPGHLNECEDPRSIAFKLSLVSDLQYYEIPTPTGFCLLVKKEAWDAHGPFDYDLYGEAYGEECEFWASCVKNGERAVVATDSFVWHQGNGSYGKLDGKLLETKAVRLFLSRHGELLETRASKYRKEYDYTIGRVCNRIPAVACSPNPKVCYFLNDWGVYGGVFAIANIINRILFMGIDPRISIIYSKSDGMGALPCLTVPRELGSHAAAINHFAERVFDSGIVVATVWNTVQTVVRIAEKNPGIIPTSFIQDYEAIFTDPNGELYTKPENVIETYGMVDRKIVNSDWVLDKMQREHRATGCELIHVGVDNDLFYPRVGFRGDDDRTVLFFYRPSTPRRGSEFVKKVCKEIAKRDKTVRMISFGGTDRDMPVEVEQLGEIPQSKVAELYSISNVFLEGSSQQGFGLQGLEAMASGCALVSTRNLGIDNYGVDGENCELVDFDDVDATVGSILGLLDDHHKRGTLVENGRNTALRFDWWKIAKQHADFYKDLWENHQK